MADGALSPAEVAHFLAFGYVHRRRCFSPQEMAMLTERADELLGRSPPENGFLEPVLGRGGGRTEEVLSRSGVWRATRSVDLYAPTREATVDSRHYLASLFSSVFGGCSLP